MKWDLFISHATEDKDNIVRHLANELRSHGLKVWYDEFSLTLGDSLSRSIDKGLSQSQFGLVVLSKYFFEKEWPRRELDGLVAREISEGKVILPIWHGVDHSDVIKYSPILADKIAVQSSKGILFVVNKILEIVKPVPTQVVELTNSTLRTFQHEVRSPLDGILSHVEWMEYNLKFNLSNLNRDHTLTKLDDIKQNITLIQMLIDIIGPQDNNITLNFRLFDLKQALIMSRSHLINEAALKMVQVEIETNNLSSLEGNESSLIHVFYNLIRNAIRFSDKKEKVKYLKIIASKEKNNVLLQFIDNGIGIIEGEEEIIFNQYVRGSNAARVSPNGAGLGLYVCREVVKQHGGVIRIERNHLVKPTIFSIRIPLRH